MFEDTMKSPYKKSIWDQDSRYEINDVEIGEDERQVISRLMSVDAAKKYIPPKHLIDVYSDNFHNSD